MGDPHKNVWGGKNNSWGHRNRNSNNSSNNKNTYRPTKLFNVLAGGCLLFIAGALGFSMITSAFKTVTGFADKVDKATQLVDDMTQQNVTAAKNSGAGNSNSLMQRTSIIDELDFDIDASDIEDILNKLYEDYKSNNLSSEVDTMILVEYNDVNTVKKYKKTIIDRLGGYSDLVSFGIVCTSAESQDDLSSKIDELQKLVSDNIDLLKGTGFTRTLTGGQTNIPEYDDFIFTVTYMS